MKAKPKAARKRTSQKRAKAFTGVHALLVFPSGEDHKATLDLMRRFSAAVRYAYNRLLEGQPREELKRHLLAWAYARATGLWGAAAEGPPPEGLEAKARLLPALTAALAAGVAGLAGGPIAALAAAGSEDLLLKGREFRMYPLLGLFWALAYLGALRRNLPLAALLVAAALLGAKRRSFPLWAGATALALWTHYLAGAVALSLGLPFGRRALLPLLAFLPWLPAVAHQASKVHQLYHWNQDPYARLKEMLLLLYGAPFGGGWPSPTWPPQPWTPWSSSVWPSGAQGLRWPSWWEAKRWSSSLPACSCFPWCMGCGLP